VFELGRLLRWVKSILQLLLPLSARSAPGSDCPALPCPRRACSPARIATSRSLGSSAARRHWRRIKPSMRHGVPRPRHFHSVVPVGRRIFVLCGYDGAGWRSDGWFLNIGGYSGWGWAAVAERLLLASLWRCRQCRCSLAL